MPSNEVSNSRGADSSSEANRINWRTDFLFHLITGNVEEPTGEIGWHDCVAVKAADPFHSSAALQKLAHHACFWSGTENDIF